MGGPMISEKKWGDLPFLGGPWFIDLFLGGPYIHFLKNFSLVTSLFRQIERSVKKDHCLFQSIHELMTLWPKISWKLENWGTKVSPNAHESPWKLLPNLAVFAENLVWVILGMKYLIIRNNQKSRIFFFFEKIRFLSPFTPYLCPNFVFKLKKKWPNAEEKLFMCLIS